MTSLHTILLATLIFTSAISPSKCISHSANTRNATDTSISKISYSTTGGRSGNYESLNISADSLIYVQARRGNEKTIKGKTAKELWKSLAKSINLNDFAKIKSNPGHALYDGIDVTLLIETGTRNHTVVNGNEDTVGYKRIKPFTNILEKQLAELRKKIIW